MSWKLATLALTAALVPTAHGGRVDGSNWIREFQSYNNGAVNTRLRDMTFVGTHNSGTKACLGISECQDTTLVEQVKEGARHLDFRVSCSGENDPIRFFHGDKDGIAGIFACKAGDAEGEFREVVDWVKSNPGELVFVELHNATFEQSCKARIIAMMKYALQSGVAVQNTVSSYVSTMKLVDATSRGLVLVWRTSDPDVEDIVESDSELRSYWLRSERVRTNGWVDKRSYDDLTEALIGRANSYNANSNVLSKFDFYSSPGGEDLRSPRAFASDNNPRFTEFFARLVETFKNKNTSRPPNIVSFDYLHDDNSGETEGGIVAAEIIDSNFASVRGAHTDMNTGKVSDTVMGICPKSTPRVCGLQQHVESDQGWFGDDSAVNALRMTCCGDSGSEVIDLGGQPEGEWKAVSDICSSSISGIRSYYESDGSTGVNGLAMVGCNGADIEVPGRMPWGNSESSSTCPADYYVCGVRHYWSNDDTGSEGVRVLCCTDQVSGRGFMGDLLDVPVGVIAGVAAGLVSVGAGFMVYRRKTSSALVEDSTSTNKDVESGEQRVTEMSSHNPKFLGDEKVDSV